jgi:2-polyprenyl-3-methyl-5-hydroxy-6-metoxy-1,4-benzoquinol methylase
MYEFHKDKKRYFNIQREVTEEYIIPFLKNHIDLDKSINVLEIGCAEAGVLKAFTNLNHRATGIELSPKRVESASHFMAKELEENKVNFIVRNIYDIDTEKDLPFKYDLIVLKDVIEHIHEQHKFLAIVRKFLNPEGQIFFAFPPWQMPFGGHQQICKSKFLSKLPYFHLLPKFLYKAILKLFGETETNIESLLEIKETGISIERFERLIQQSHFEVLKKQHFLFNPIYKYKFGIQPKNQFSIIQNLPYLRNFFTMGVYYLVK